MRKWGVPMNRRGISGTLLAVAGLVPLALIIDFALLYVSFPNATEYLVFIDVPIFAGIGAILFMSRRRAQRTEKKEPPPTSALDKLKERNGGRRAPTESAKSILDNDEEGEAEVFMQTLDVEKSASDVDQILQRIKARDMDLGVGPIPEVEAREPPEIVEQGRPVPQQVTAEKKAKFNGKTKDYALSPEKLKVPAFICRCGHPHRFVCLTCGLTAEVAVKKSKMHWVEWVPEMGARP
jgi:hypothetical protein